MSDVEIYIVDLSKVSLRVAISQLTRQDLSQAASMSNDDVQQCFIKSRAVLINILTSHLTRLNAGLIAPVRSLALDYNEYGKPYLKDYENLHFNISHSGKYLLIALAGFPVGIDIEQITKSELLSETAKVVFSDEECLQLCDENMSGYMEKFYNFWTRKEAYIKALGCGFSCDPKLISTHDFTGRVKDERPKNDDQDLDPAARWHVYSLNIFKDFAAALAVPHSNASFSVKEYGAAKDYAPLSAH